MEPQAAQKDSLLKNPLTYIVALVVVIALVGSYLLFQVIGVDTKTQGADYVENLPKDKVSVGILLEVSGLYPNIPFDVDSISINNNIFEGLTILRGGRLQPALAESWTNPDDLTWRIKLRDGVMFHNGEELEAADVKYSIEEAKKNEGWVSNSFAARVSSVSVIDDATVELKTVNPDPTLLHWLVFVFVLSKDQVEKDGLEKAVGSGPYKLESISDTEIALSANSDYWAGSPKVKELVYKAFESKKAIADGIKSGEADIGLLSENTFNKELEQAGFRVVPTDIGDINMLGMNTASEKTAQTGTDKNPLVDANVRKAIFYALDVQKILAEADADGRPLTQFGVPDLIGYNTNLKRDEPDLTKAKEFMKKSDFPDGFTVTLDLDEPALKTGEEIKRQLAQINIEVKLNPYKDFGAFLERLSTESSMYIISYVPDTLDSTDLLNSFFHTPDEKGNGAFNLRSYSNKDIDDLIDQAATTFDTKKRAEIASNTHKKIMDELPVIPLYTRIGYFILPEDVSFKPAPFSYIFGFEITGREKVTTTE